MKDWEILEKVKEFNKHGGITAEENYELLLQYNKDKANGVEPINSDARTILLLANEGLIYKALISMGIPDVQDSEEYSVAKTALVKAIDRFGLNNVANFSTFAIKVMQNAVLRDYTFKQTQGRDNRYNTIPLDDCYLVDDFFKHTMAKHFITDENIQEDCAFASIVNMMISKFKYLHPREQKIMVEHFGLCGGEKKTYERIGEEFGVATERVRQIVEKTLVKLKILMTKRTDLTPEQMRYRKKIVKEQYPLIKEINIYYNNITL